MTTNPSVNAARRQGGGTSPLNQGFLVLLLVASLALLVLLAIAARAFAAHPIAPPAPDPRLVLWYTHPADKWENALPVGNGRLGAMVFGRTDEEQIQLNEDTYWKDGKLAEATILSRLGNTCRVRSAVALKVSSQGRTVPASRPANDVVEFKTAPGATYILTGER